MWLAVLLLAGCAAGIQKKAVWAPAPGMRAAPFVEVLWTQTPARYKIRLEGLLEFGPRKLLLGGLMVLDTGKRFARLAAMNEMGLTLFDITAAPSGSVAHKLAPDLKSVPQFEKRAAAMLQRIFFTGQVEHDAPVYQQTTPGAEQGLVKALAADERRELDFLFNSGDKTLAQKRSEKQEWRAAFSAFRPAPDRLPGKIEYEDERLGFTLTLRVLEVKTL